MKKINGENIEKLMTSNPESFKENLKSIYYKSIDVEWLNSLKVYGVKKLWKSSFEIATLASPKTIHVFKDHFEILTPEIFMFQHKGRHYIVKTMDKNKIAKIARITF